MYFKPSISIADMSNKSWGGRCGLDLEFKGSITLDEKDMMSYIIENWSKFDTDLRDSFKRGLDAADRSLPVIIGKELVKEEEDFKW